MWRRVARAALIVAIGTGAAVAAQQAAERTSEPAADPDPPPRSDPLPEPPPAAPPLAEKGAGPNPYIVVGAALAAGFALGKLVDWKSRG